MSNVTIAIISSLSLSPLKSVMVAPHLNWCRYHFASMIALNKFTRWACNVSRAILMFGDNLNPGAFPFFIHQEHIFLI